MRLAAGFVAQSCASFIILNLGALQIPSDGNVLQGLNHHYPVAPQQRFHDTIGGRNPPTGVAPRPASDAGAEAA